ncbi:MAG: hypothetical protein ACRDWV_01235 [Acidimicrobiales bacterium]
MPRLTVTLPGEAQDRPGFEVLTSDPDDLHHLLQALNLQRAIRVV